MICSKQLVQFRLPAVALKLRAMAVLGVQVDFRGKHLPSLEVWEPLTRGGATGGGGKVVICPPKKIAPSALFSKSIKKLVPSVRKCAQMRGESADFSKFSGEDPRH